MSDTSLPDEILSEILSPALKVADDAFSDTSTAAFATYQESTSAYLLVNKAWLRVSTPLLYHTVVLRSKAQAAALAGALTKNKDLARFVKRLRVEGGFGPSMKTILALTLNVADLFLSVDIYSNDSTAGLCSGLKLISPASLTISMNGGRLRNKMRTALANALAAAIAEWPRLVTVDTSSTYGISQDPDGRSIFKALADAKRLQNLTVPSAYVAEVTYSLLQACPLRVIESKEAQGPFNHLSSGSKPALNALLVYRASRSAQAAPATPEIAAPPLNPLFQPLQAVPSDVRAVIWTRILYFAMETPQRASYAREHARTGSMGSVNMKRHIRLPFLLVSKEFLKLGLPLFHSHILLTWDNAEQFRVNHHRCQSVESICGSKPMTGSVFADAARHHGSTLIDLCISVQGAGANQSGVDGISFLQLTALKRLHWTGAAPLTSFRHVPGILPNLEELTLRTVDKSLVALFARAQHVARPHIYTRRIDPLSRLPRLRSFRLVGEVFRTAPEATVENLQLIKAHIGKLYSLTVPSAIADALGAHFLELGGQLSTLTLVLSREDHPPSIASLSPPKPSSTLTLLVFTLHGQQDGNPKRKDIVANWNAFFAGWKYKTAVPNLAAIKITSFRWPTTERDIAKDPWVPHAEKLLNDGVQLLDSGGKKWRRRLQLTRAA